MSDSVFVNDVHSALNGTLVPEIHFPESVGDLARLVRRARLREWKLSVCGGRHSMGGQPFGEECHLVDLGKMNSVVELDEERGLLKAQAGLMWPELVGYLREARSGWLIRQKQTGADHLSLGGALAVNMHGRGLGMAPFVGDLEELTVVCADGTSLVCSRRRNSELFALVVGGYGGFGIVAEVTLRLKKRARYRRDVTLVTAGDAVSWLEKARGRGAEYGDFQFQIDPESEAFLQEGISSCYYPTALPISEGEVPSLDPGMIESLLNLAHVDPGRAYQEYADHYARTDGAVYEGDQMQMSAYPVGYHQRLDQKCGTDCAGSEMISELYVPRNELAGFLAAAARFLRGNGSQVIYGTVRLIEKDEVSFLPWARESWACIVFNLHVDHCSEGIGKAKRAFRGLIDLALAREGSFYLAYHRWATKEQLLAAYPQFPEWLSFRGKYDPAELWQSGWLRWISASVVENEKLLVRG